MDKVDKEGRDREVQVLNQENQVTKLRSMFLNLSEEKTALE